ncbi:RsmB/NOP family class I SAM-dependent RNA methyltransferase [Candidatus Woesearchaeota archaeon]|nr:RsmB/NOP family class I SAM-dependent RNA methyltransferase [Candidatus Woesearchaeota archaeon]
MADLNLTFKENFIKRYEKLTDINQFLEYSQRFLRRSIRVNTIKISVKELKARLKDWNLEQIPWCKEGFWIEHKKKERRDIGNLLEHDLGYFYVQEAASMIPPIVLNPKKNSVVLDACACPGSKTTQLADIMKNTGIIIANDDDFNRMTALKLNLQKSGAMNTVVTLGKAEYLKNLDSNFDYILLDAPCSGTGVIRKSPRTALTWNPNTVKKLAGVQKHMMMLLFEKLNKGGTLVYSTCSLEPDEDEAVVDFLLDRFEDAKLEDIKLDIKRSPAVMKFEGVEFNKEIKKCLRIFPQDNDTEGFFVAKMHKN